MKRMERVLIDQYKFQQRILDCVTTDEVDKIFNATVFASNPESQECRQAMIHGMIMASMMTCQCDPIFITENIKKDETCYSANYMEEVAKMLGVELNEEFKLFMMDVLQLK